MLNWAAELTRREPSDQDILDYVESTVADRDETSSLIEEMQAKLAQAHQAGISLARSRGEEVFDSVLEKNAKRIVRNYENKRSEDRWETEQRHRELMAKKAEAEKVAILPLLGGVVARTIGGQAAKQGLNRAVGGAMKDVAKNVVADKATSAASNALNRAKQPAQMTSAAGGFKYAKIGGVSGLVQGLSGQAKNLTGAIGGKGPGTFGQKLVGGMVRNPGAALIGAGMLGGAAMAPRDQVTGEKQYIRGALRGGVVGGGAYALGGGNALRKAVVNPKGPQIFGERAGAYARNATKATAPSAVSKTQTAPPLASSTQFAREPSVQVDPRLAKEHDTLARRRAHIRNVEAGGGGSVQARGFLGGQTQLQVPSNHMVSGGMTTKFANRQTLNYNPSTKSFTRTHLTADTTMGPEAENVIPAGRSEAVPSHRSGPVGPASPGLPPSRGPSQVFTSADGNVLSSASSAGAAPRPQVSARPMTAPPPIPAAAKMKRPIATGVGAALRAVPAPSLPSLAGARSLVRR